MLCVACTQDDDTGSYDKSSAEKKDSTIVDSTAIIFYQNDGIIRYIRYSEVDSVRPSGNGSIRAFYFNDRRVACYHINFLDSISFNRSSAITISAFPKASDYISAIDSATAPAHTNVTEPSAPSDEEEEGYSDYIENFNVKNTITFTWSGNNVTWSGTVPSDVSITKDNGHVTVESSKGKMRYRLQGTTEDGSFKIANMNNAESDNKKFILELYGVDITNPNGPAINIQSSKTVLVNMPKDKVNSLKDGSTYTQVDGESRKGTFFSEGQLVFSGPGTLNVTSLGGHGICSDDYVRLRYNVGEINITAVKDGINTKDYFLMYGGTVKINSSGDGIGVRRGG